MQNSNRPRRITKPWASSAGNGYVRSVPTAAQSGGVASYEQGFPPVTFQPVASGGVPPSGQDMNGVLQDATGNALWLAAGGAAMFDAAFATAVGGYPMYAVLASTTVGRFWQSRVDNNTTNPDADATNWAAVANPVDVGSNYERRAGGILDQWGSVVLTSTSEPVVAAAFPQPFTDGTYNVIATGYLNAASTSADTWVQVVQSSRTQSGFSVQYQSISDQRPKLDGFNWRAIGKG